MAKSMQKVVEKNIQCISKILKMDEEKVKELALFLGVKELMEYAIIMKAVKKFAIEEEGKEFVKAVIALGEDLEEEEEFLNEGENGGGLG